ncbi:MAG: hypothetical protein QOJ07_3151 [Thermoleophilaceae bacterium]|nr:hypothetical protein [Thermoleophilaceae bacterium]
MTAPGQSGGVDEVEQRRREVERARSELSQSVEQLSQRAVATRESATDRIREVAVPVAIGVAGLLLARALRRRRRARPLLEVGPFVLLERR